MNMGAGTRRGSRTRDFGARKGPGWGKVDRIFEMKCQKRGQTAKINDEPPVHQDARC